MLCGWSKQVKEGWRLRIIEGILRCLVERKKRRDKATDKEKSWISCGKRRRGTPSHPESGLCLTLRIELSEETHVAMLETYREETPG